MGTSLTRWLRVTHVTWVTRNHHAGDKGWCHDLEVKKKNLTAQIFLCNCVLGLHKGVLFVDLIAHGQEVNSVLYRETLDRLSEAVCQKRAGRLPKGAILTKECLPLPWYDWNVLLHSLHRFFYLVLLDHHMFGFLKWHLLRKRRPFHTNDVVFARIQGCLHLLDATFFEKGYYTLVHQSASISMAATYKSNITMLLTYAQRNKYVEVVNLSDFNFCHSLHLPFPKIPFIYHIPIL